MNKIQNYIQNNYSILLLLITVAVLSCQMPGKEEPKLIRPINAPFEMPQLQRPIFAQRDFNIIDFGAVNDTTIKNTVAFKVAIDSCHKSGGGRIIVPAGIWISGPIHLKSNVNLHLQKGAEIRFSNDFDDYLPAVFRRRGQEFYSYSSMIYARDCENIAITGEGLINGQGDVFWKWHWKQSDTEKNATEFIRQASKDGLPAEERMLNTEEAAIRPCVIETMNCKNVLLEDFTTTGSAAWTINLVYCENVIVREIEIEITGDGPNLDGVNPNSCKNVLIEDCLFSTGDDGVAIKSGRDEDGWRVNKPSENIVVRNCRFTDESGGPHGRIAIGSEMSGGVKNVLIDSCYFKNTHGCINIKSKRGRGGAVENVWVQNIFVDSLLNATMINLTTFFGFGKNWIEVKSLSEAPPLFRNIHFKNFNAKWANVPISVRGLPEKWIENISFENITVDSSQKGVSCVNARGVKFSNIEVKNMEGPLFDLENSAEVTIDSYVNNGSELFARISGKYTKKITILGVEPSELEKMLEVAKEVPDGGVKINYSLKGD